MEHEQRILDAFKKNKIDKILLIDDAYDPPAINDEISGELLDFLQGKKGCEICTELQLDETVREYALTALRENSFEDDQLNKVNMVLFEAFVKTNDSRYDPGNHFETVKIPTLDILKPLHELLKKCGDNVDVRTVGIKDDIYRHLEFDPQILFLDYYLEPEGGNNGGDQFTVGRSQSLELLRRFLHAKGDTSNVPAIVLMSKQLITDVDQYRHDIGGEQVLSLRFGFLKKDHIQLDGSQIKIERAAVDVLLDTSQGYLFGRELQQALNGWKIGANKAFEAFLSEVANLHIKDFAYLLRFRLQDEGQPISEYMEWLFGEFLLGLINERVDWSDTSFLNLDEQKELSESIEGAYDGPTERIARIYHRIKVNKPRSGKGRGYRFGDIYVNRLEENIRTVITPDCDLVVRKNRRKVNNILTMGGKLSQFDKHESFADDIFLHDGDAYFLQWNLKDLETIPVQGKDSLENNANFELVGTLRPLYAYAMQRRVLRDVGRIGLPVAPALGLNAKIDVWIRIRGSGFERVNITEDKVATIIPARSEGKIGHRVLLRRAFFNELIDYLKGVERLSLDLGDREKLKRLQREYGINILYKKYIEKGALIEDSPTYGFGLTFKAEPIRKKGSPWLQITIEVSDEIKNQLPVFDPM